MRDLELVIFDCDGVLVDSEVLTNTVFRDMLIELGAAVTLTDMFEQFVGHTMKHTAWHWLATCWADLCPTTSRRGIASGAAKFCVSSSSRYRESRQALSRIDLPMCVASSGDHEKMRTTLGVTGLLGHFEGRSI